MTMADLTLHDRVRAFDVDGAPMAGAASLEEPLR